MPKSVYLGVLHLTLFPVLLGLALARLSADQPGQTAGPVAGKARLLPGKYVASEPSLAVGTEGQIVVAAMEGADQTATRLMVWRSEDGGRTWLVPSYLPRSSEVGMIQGDPWLQPMGPGKFAIAYYARNNEAKNRPAAVFQQSDDGGKTWAAPHVLHRGVDKTVLAVSPSGKQLAAAFTTFDPPKGAGVQVHCSSDGGITWKQVPTPFPGKRSTYQADGIVITDRGAIAVGWDVQAGMRYRRVLTSTTDHGKAWHESELAPAPVEVKDLFCRGPALTLDGDGSAHALWMGGPGANGQDVVFRSSNDFRAWSDPLVLAAGSDAEWRGFPALAANGRRLHAAWMERKSERYHVWYRGSADGGATWSERVLLSCPERPSALLTADGFEGPFGHYMSLAEDGRGKVHAVWGVGQLFKDASETRGEIWHNVIRWSEVGTDGSADPQL